MRTIEELEAEAIAILNRAVETFNPVAIFAGFSGGKDSLCAIELAAKLPGFTGAFHANTGIGIEATRQYVRDYCSDRGWLLEEIRAKEDCGQDYEQMVLHAGFPGAGHHTKMYNRLKERCIRKLKSRHAARKTIAIVTGIRQSESQRRMLTAAKEFDCREGFLWVNPCLHWSSEERNFYIRSKGFKINPVTELLCMSGECLCGAYARPNEKEEIRLWFPETAAYLDDLEERVKAAGFPWGWDEQPPKWWNGYKSGQQFIPELESMFLCHSCEAKKAA